MNTASPAPPAAARIETRIAPLREKLAAHPLYLEIRTLAELRLFMESHVFAVWDFMSLLKSLQRTLTSVSVPWVPTPFPASRRFLNEIVLGEESDLYDGQPASHFEMYLSAMRQAGASTAAIDALLGNAPTGNVIFAAETPAEARAFVEDTFRIIERGSPAAQAGAFAFGREDLIPAMFRALVRDLNHELSGRLDRFVWYLERHIEVDGDDHGPLALGMVADLCGDSAERWEEAARAAETALQSRLALWDGILSRIEKHRVISG
ncbi:DUF3050 domain-containing protein [Silvibacterium dinghuense]|uniref:DUF3050 domain-containing protein n=1 Tax=Silvibacterium dinghuense TaxID=1560006 RepID=A0A4Q1SHQ2_9BACT|nr:DUF3050 domain-containing protein [Silvibacterium dinghuense]RXS96905.1 DUF3050 domain-containing protein [Silvibacterium dinghuense]GGG94573.1 hypothetical protein GCM10011586_06860 [Silvibacterium dinghuense]